MTVGCPIRRAVAAGFVMTRALPPVSSRSASSSARPDTLGLRISSTIGKSTWSSPSSQFRSSTAMSESMPSCKSGVSPSSRSGDVPSTRATLSRSSVATNPGRPSGSAARMASRPGKAPFSAGSWLAVSLPAKVGESRRYPARHPEARPARPLHAHHADLDVLALDRLLQQGQRLPHGEAQDSLPLQPLTQLGSTGEVADLAEVAPVDGNAGRPLARRYQAMASRKAFAAA